MKHRRHFSHGFTVVEMLIATSVFSVILLLVTYGLLKVNGAYYKGITQSKAQETARSVLDSISQDIQFGGGAINLPASFTGTYALCIGNNRYSVNLGNELKDGSGGHSLVKDNPATCAPSSAITNLTGGTLPTPSTELLAPSMRLAVLRATPTATDYVYKVHIRLVYGDDDLLCSPSSADPNDHCDSGTTTSTFTGDDLSCKPRAGSQFCAVSDLSTSVQKRVL